MGRISFFVNSGIKFITEMCKMRAFVDLWDEITKERYGVKNNKGLKNVRESGTKAGVHNIFLRKKRGFHKIVKERS